MFITTFQWNAAKDFVMGSAKYIHGSATKETLKKEKNRKKLPTKNKD